MRQSFFIGRHFHDRHHRSDCRRGGFLDFQGCVSKLFRAQLDPLPTMVSVLVVAFFFVRGVGRIGLEQPGQPAKASALRIMMIDVRFMVGLWKVV